LPELLLQLQSKFELYGKETIVEEKKPEVEQKLKELQEKVQEHEETLSGKELIPGIENPQIDCPACERPVKDCVCYTGLPNPRVEFDGKKVTIFFKSAWGEEDRLNFVDDLKRRAGTILDKRRILKAQDTLVQIRKKLGGN
jgi:hypothetical protein